MMDAHKVTRLVAPVAGFGLRLLGAVLTDVTGLLTCALSDRAIVISS